MEPNKLPTYIVLARTMGAYIRCVESGNTEWEKKHFEKLLSVNLPSGAGFDNGTLLDIHKSTENVLYFHTSFHHMNGDGYYDGWTDHTITVRPSLAFGFSLTISGRNRNAIKDYIHEIFSTLLKEEIAEF